MTCPDCGRELVPAPARFDGEDTFVGFRPCVCSWTIYLEYHWPDESLAEYRERVSRVEREIAEAAPKTIASS